MGIEALTGKAGKRDRRGTGVWVRRGAALAAMAALCWPAVRSLRFAPDEIRAALAEARAPLSDRQAHVLGRDAMEFTQYLGARFPSWLRPFLRVPGGGRDPWGDYFLPGVRRRRLDRVVAWYNVGAADRDAQVIHEQRSVTKWLRLSFRTSVGQRFMPMRMPDTITAIRVRVQSGADLSRGTYVGTLWDDLCRREQLAEATGVVEPGAEGATWLVFRFDPPADVRAERPMEPFYLEIRGEHGGAFEHFVVGVSESDPDMHGETYVGGRPTGATDLAYEVEGILADLGDGVIVDRWERWFLVVVEKGLAEKLGVAPDGETDFYEAVEKARR